MSKKERPMDTGKRPDEIGQVKNQNQQHNTKKEALGPNTRR